MTTHNKTSNKIRPAHSGQKTSTSKAMGLHHRNPHQGRYDFSALTRVLPQLAKHTITSPKGEPTINFSDSEAVLTLNKALLMLHYGIKFWDIPKGYLCPPIPGRADYIHHIADLINDHANIDAAKQKATQHSLANSSNKRVHVLDIGTGASCIYPIIGTQSYGWRFTATDIDPVAVNTAKLICQSNANLKDVVKIKQQKKPNHIFHGVIGDDDFFDVSICNPPFHASFADAVAANTLKQEKLAQHRRKRGQSGQHDMASKMASKVDKNTKSATTNANFNFGGQHSELWSKGGEIAFITKMINESQDYAQQVGWFTTLVSKSENLKPLTQLLEKLQVAEIQVIDMKHGQKLTRILAWRFNV